MNPIADLEALAIQLEARCNKYPEIHATGCSCSYAHELRAVIATLKKRGEAVRKVAEEMASPDMAALASAAVQGMTTTASVIDVCAAWAARLREIVK